MTDGQGDRTGTWKLLRPLMEQGAEGNLPMSTPTMGARPVPRAYFRDRGMLATGAAVLVVAAAAWVGVVRQAAVMGQTHMTSPGGAGMISFPDAAIFLAGWGVMMAAMMLPSALPMIVLYQTVSRHQSRAGSQVIPAAVFAGTYLAVWVLTGIPVYLASAGIGAFAAGAIWLPYALAAVLAAAGAFQFSGVKQVCLKHCQSPLTFITIRWRGGYAGTLHLGLSHAAYCVGCCWGLMVVLVAAGAMSLPWVLAIAAVVFVEKSLRRGQLVARIVGSALILLGLAITIHPGLAVALRGGGMPGMTDMAAMAGVPGIGVARAPVRRVDRAPAREVKVQSGAAEVIPRPKDGRHCLSGKGCRDGLANFGTARRDL
jgi:predicted metal-binding membrane protein